MPRIEYTLCDIDIKAIGKRSAAKPGSIPDENMVLAPTSAEPRIAAVSLSGREPCGYTSPDSDVATMFLPAASIRHRSAMASFMRCGVGAAYTTQPPPRRGSQLHRRWHTRPAGRSRRVRRVPALLVIGVPPYPG